MKAAAADKALSLRMRRRRRRRRLVIPAGVFSLLVLFAPTLLSLGPAAWLVRRQARAQWPGTPAVVVAGTVADLAGRRAVDLTAALAYDAQDQTGRISAFPPGQALDGRRQGRITLGGPIAGRDLREVLGGLTAAGALDLDLTADPPVLTVPYPVDPAQVIGFNERVAVDFLACLNPAIAELGQAAGAVSVRCENLRLPLGRDWQRRFIAEGRVRFTRLQVESSRLLGLLLVALRERPVGVVGDIPDFPLTVRDGRVHCGVIRLPLKDLEVELTGSAGLDGTLELVAAPLTDRMLANRRDLKRCLAEVKVRVAIGGTMKDPKIEERAVRKAVEGVIQDALKKALEEGARGWLERLLDKKPLRRSRSPLSLPRRGAGVRGEGDVSPAGLPGRVAGGFPRPAGAGTWAKSGTREGGV